MAKVAARGDNIVEFPKKSGLKAEKGAMDFTLLFCILILFVAGLSILFSASSGANMRSGNVYGPILKQAVLGVCGLVVMFIVSNIDYSIVRRLSGIAYFIGLGMMFAVPIIGFASHGATRQIDLKIISIQPSEFSKYFLIIWLAAQFSVKRNERADTWDEIRNYVIWIALPVLACFLQSHASAALVHLAIGGVMVLARGIDKKKMRVLIPLGIIAMIGVIAIVFLTGGYRVERLMSYLGINNDDQDIGWQANQSMLAVGSGGLFGLGIGNSRQKYSYLPEAENDYIFAIAAEELGFIGSLIIIILFMVVIWRGVLIAINCKDSFGSYLAFGISALIGIQTFINMGVVLKLLPSTGMQLPLFSSGGTSLMITLAGFGLLLSISRNIRASKV